MIHNNGRLIVGLLYEYISLDVFYLTVSYFVSCAFVLPKGFVLIAVMTALINKSTENDLESSFFSICG